jgi:hypothetical protein
MKTVYFLIIFAFGLNVTYSQTVSDACPCVAPDGSCMIFTSERPVIIGVSDLYIILKKEDGNWSEPINMEACNARINIKEAVYRCQGSEDKILSMRVLNLGIH